MDKPVGRFTLRRSYYLFRSSYPAPEITEGLVDGTFRQADPPPDIPEDRGIDLVEMDFSAVDQQCQRLVEVVVDGGAYDIIGRRQSQACRRFKQGKVLQVGIAVSE